MKFEFENEDILHVTKIYIISCFQDTKKCLEAELRMKGVRFMNTIRMELEMPSEILNYVSASDSDYSARVRELMIYALIQEYKISFGKGAQMLGMTKVNFITDLGN